MQGCGAVFDADRALLNHCTFSECYECHKGFCMTCQTPWHTGKFIFYANAYFFLFYSRFIL